MLSRGTSDTTAAPVVSRVTLMANPAPSRRVKIVVPLQLHQHLRLRNGQTAKVDPSFERAQIEALLQSNEIVTFQEVGASYSVTIDDFHWVPYEKIDQDLDGTLVVELKVQS